MSCRNIRPLISALADGPVAAADREVAVAHLEVCRECALHYDALRTQRAALRSMANVTAPAMMVDKLRVLGSHERARQQVHNDWSSRIEKWQERVELQIDNLMKPVALPFMGGLLSAMLMFGVLIQNVSFAHSNGKEPPSPVFTAPDGQIVGEGEFPRLQQTYQGKASGRIVVILTIDDRGRVRDYMVTQGNMTPELQEFILFSTFTPATMFGKPTWGQVQAVFGSDNEKRS